MLLATIWFILWSVLWAVYFMLDGFDLGLGTLLPCVAKSESEKKVVYNAAGPFWDGNEVWLIAAGGVTFAAFPKTYAVMFSALYLPLLLLLLCLILRAVSFEFRDKVDSRIWRCIWDLIHFVVNMVAAILLGVAFANLFAGIPLNANGVLEGRTLLSFINIYSVAGGIFFLMMFCLHGALWLCFKTTEGELQERALRYASTLWKIVLVLLLAFLVLTALFTGLYGNYIDHPILLLIPILALLSLIHVKKSLDNRQFLKAWLFNSGFIFGVTAFGVAGMFPSMLISSLDPAATLTAFNSCSSPLTLKIMLAVALVMVPIVLLYQFWAYRLFSHKLDANESSEEEQSY